MIRRTALGIPAYRRLWTAGLISDAGDWLLFIALPILVFQLTGSASATAVAFLLELAPSVALAPVAARLADRVDRRRLMAAVNLAQALVLLPLLLVDTAEELPLLYAVIAGQAALSTIFEPAKNALLPSLVPADRLTSANALTGLNQDLGRLAGGPLGGVLLIVGGLPLLVVIDAVTYLLSAALVLGVRVPPDAADAGPAEGEAAGADRAGLLGALRLPQLRGILAATLTAGVAQGLFVVLFVLFVLERVQGSEAEVGLLRGIQAVGAIAAGLVIAFAVRTGRPPVLVLIGAAAFGILSLAIWNLPYLTTSLGWYIALFIAIGAPGVLLSTGMIGVIQTRVAAHRRGAAFAAWGLAHAVGQAIGMLLAALADGPVGLMPLLELQGLLYLATAAITLLMVRTTRGER